MGSTEAAGGSGGGSGGGGSAGEPMGAQAATAMRSWQLANEVAADPAFLYDDAEDAQIRQDKPWTRDPQYFTDVRVSALALIKMVMHARSGGNLEIMGLVQGRITAHTMVVMDSFALPVEGTETRVNAQAQAYEYMSTYTSQCEELGKKDKVIGWYHSHPGYGCWLSGIDVSTQALHQQYQEPFVALVLDPVRTISAGKVDLGAFRTYPKGFKPADEGPSEYQPIPLNKIEDFGVHCKQYYQLAVTYFKSPLDSRLLNSLWNSYWVNTLSANALLTNAGYITSQIRDLSEKLEQAETSVGRQARFNDPMVLSGASSSAESASRRRNDPLTKCIRDSNKIVCEAVHGLIAQNLKYALFGHRSAPMCEPCPADRMETDEAPGGRVAPPPNVECRVGELAAAADALCEVNAAADVAAEVLA